jgi:hypothetical protein
MRVATLGGPTMFARISKLLALDHGKPDRAVKPPKRAKKYVVMR